MKHITITVAILLCILGCQQECITPSDVGVSKKAQSIGLGAAFDTFTHCAIEEEVTNFHDTVVVFYPDTLVQGLSHKKEVQGEAFAKKINIDWNAVVAFARQEPPLGTEKVIRMSFLTYGSDLHNRISESLTVRSIPLSLGCHDFTPHPSQTNRVFAGYSIWDTDFMVEGYLLDTSAYNYFEITKVDTINNQMKGLFAFSFVKREGGPRYRVFQDTVRFFNGRFSTEFDLL